MLYSAATEVFGDSVRLFAAGRTDAGVHALGQVVSVHLDAALPREAAKPLEALRRAWNDLLPFDVHVLSLVPAPATFHARHDADLRVYRYRISRRRTAFGKPYVWWVKDALDADAMARAASLFVGRHDFASFCENADGHDSTLVEVKEARVFTPESVPDLIVFRITASHFLWKMVRRLTGTLVEVGTGRLAEKDVKGFLETRSGAPAAFTAPPSGLFLEGVTYAGDPPLRLVDPLRPAF